MEIETRDLGRVEIDESEIIKFPQGIPGFIDKYNYVLLNFDKDSPFVVLQSVDEVNLAFITINPWLIVNDYSLDLSDSILKLLDIKDKEDVTVLVLVTIRDSYENMTLNLSAPLVINVKTKLAKQFINENDYPLRYKVFPQGFKQEQVAK